MLCCPFRLLLPRLHQLRTSGSPLPFLQRQRQRSLKDSWKVAQAAKGDLQVHLLPCNQRMGPSGNTQQLALRLLQRMAEEETLRRVFSGLAR